MEDGQLIVAPLYEDVDTTPCRQDFTVESRGPGKLGSQSRSQSACVRLCVSNNRQTGRKGRGSVEEVPRCLSK